MRILKGTADYLKSDQEHIIHPISIVGEVSGLVFNGGQGVMLRDTDGREYIDGCAGAANVNVGHGREEIAEAAMAQMKKLAYVTTFRGNSHTAQVECAEKLAELTPPGLQRFFFTCGGSESVETALKMARYYWKNKGLNKYKIISLHYGFHGSAFGSLSASALGKGLTWKGFEPIVPGFLHIPRYYCYRCQFGLEYPSCHIRCALFLEDTILNEGTDQVAAFIAEPCQGAGGMIPPPPEYWPLVREICTRNHVLLIADEVITGFGRTGRMFALEHWKVQPDLMTMAKGITSGYLPFGGVAVTEEVYEGLKVKNTPLFHLYTYSGHPVCCAAAIKNLEILTREDLTGNAARVGYHLRQRLDRLAQLPHVAGLNSLGLLSGFELVADPKSKAPFPNTPKVMDEVLKRCRERGLLLRVFSDRIGISPPLNISVAEVDRLVDILEEVVMGVGRD